MSGERSCESTLGCRRSSTTVATTTARALAELAADTERMAIRMPDMELADSPRFVGRRHRHVEPELDRSCVRRLHVFECLHEPRHPHIVRRLVERECGPPHSARALTVATKEELRVARSNAGEADSLCTIF